MPTIPYDQRSFWIESWDGSMVMPLPLEHYSSEAIALRGMMGLGVNPTDLITEGTPGVAGTRVVDVVHGERPVALPIGVLGDTQDEVWAAVQKLRDITNPGDGMTSDGNFRLVCVSASGSRELLLAYRSGLEGDDSERKWFDRFVIDCVAVMPYAQDRADQTLDFTLAQEFEPFLADSPSEAAFVQSFASSTTTSSATRTATPAATVPVGATLVAVMSSASSVTATSVTDVSGNTWTLALASDSPVSGATIYVYKSKITAAIAPGQLVTATWGSSNSANRLHVLQYKGLTGNTVSGGTLIDAGVIVGGGAFGITPTPASGPVMAIAVATTTAVTANWATPPAGIADDGTVATFTTWQTRFNGLKTAVSDAIVPGGPTRAAVVWPEAPGANGDLGIVFFQLDTAGGNSWPWGTRKLSPSTVAGDATPVQLYSSVPVYPIIEITGPADSVLITADNGLRIDIPTGIAAGDTLRIVSDPRHKSIRLDGAPAAGMLARGSRLTPFPEGITLVDVIAPGATEATLLRLTWRGLYRSVW